MRMKRLFLIPALCALCATTALAQTTNKTVSLSLEDCLQMALKHNLNLRIERYEPQIAQFSLDAARAGYEPTFDFSATKRSSSVQSRFDPDTGNLILGNETQTDSFSTGIRGQLPTGLTYDLGGDLARNSGTFYTSGKQYNSSVGISLTQPLLRNFLTDSTRYNIQLSRRQLRSSEFLLNQQIMQVVTQVEQAYYDLIFARENMKVQQAALGLAERSLSDNKKRVEVGALAPLDEKQAESEVAARKADLLSAERTLSEQENVLKNLLTDDYLLIHGDEYVPTETLNAPVPMLNLQDSWYRGLNQRPDLLNARVQVERQNITVAYNKNQMLPQLDLIGSYGRSGLSTDTHMASALEDVKEGNNPRHSYGAVFTIPLGNRAARSRYRSAMAQKEQMLLQLKQVEQTVMVEIDNAVKVAKTNFERIEATRQARLYAEAALDAEQKKLENGKSTSFQVLQLQRDLTSRRSEEIRALADYNKSLADLSQKEGATLERHGINLEYTDSE